MSKIKINRDWELPESLATSEQTFWNRRKFLQALGISSATIGSGLMSKGMHAHTAEKAARGTTGPSKLAVNNHNFVEFSQWNAETTQLAQSLNTESWPITITGLVERTIQMEAGELIRLMQLQERIYRFRCIEGWSMVVPWSGFPLKELVKLVQPTAKARYIRFDSFLEPEIAPGQRQDDWHVWPYTEVLSMDEAVNELSFLATGVYGQDLPKEQGAPLRLVVPWKYAIKSIKSITRIEFMQERPETFWEIARPGECDFYCNVDPADPHSKLSQQQEILINSGDWQATQLYNGYAEQVASLYV